MRGSKAWRNSGGALVLANNNHRKKLKYNQHRRHRCWLWPPVMVCGHVASNLEWYSQKLVKHRFWYNKRGGFGHESIDIWKSESSKFYYGCSERGPNYAPPVHESLSNGYLLIAASGGLNQQRTGITDAVVVARILNATLVVPELDHYSFWKDDSEFANIFDVDWFISILAKDIPVVKRVPDKYMRALEKPPYTMRVPRKSEPQYYLDEVLPTLLRRHVVQLTKFDYRLANDLNEELQRLRCRVNYHAFLFTKPLHKLGHKLVMRMRNMTNRYIAVHLRFEPDMLAFSGCYYGGGDKERYELGEIRKRWTNLPDLLPDGEQRKRGKCPLTPHEVGLMLRALGFNNDTYIYVASGEIYGGEETLQPLRELFPNFYTKEMLVTEELQPFLPFSSRLAAIDYIVCDESDVFVTNNNGNMAKILAGRRGFMGEPDEMKPGRADFHEYPSSCICKKPFIFSHVDNQRTINNASLNEHNEDVNSRDNDASSSLEQNEDDEFLAD
ncbi:hypothetical protein R6Q57_016579 [Mikania cordata]